MDGESRTTVIADAPVKTAELTVNESWSYKFIKRVFDIVASAVGLVVISPVLLITMLAIMLEDGASPFFLQPRIGKGCKPFRMVKLRSMRPDAEKVLEQLSDEEKEEFSKNFKLQHDPRITKVGRFIRKTSIDELPQLWNVLKGDMSLVGPRPPLLVEEEAYGEHLAKVMSVRPGITGYWQVHGRSETDFSERIELNEYYIDHRSLGLDLKILAKTVSAVVHGGGGILKRSVLVARTIHHAPGFSRVLKAVLCLPILLTVSAAGTKERAEEKAEEPPLETGAGTGYRIVKRAFDIAASGVGLLILSPLLALISVLIMLDDPKGSPIFVQTRVGKDGKEFRFYKFRSMVVNAEAQLDSLMDRNEMDGPVFKIKDDPRITRVGKFIRQTSIDELPQLWNVLKGDMSIVGPRPPVPREVIQYNDYQRQRLSVTPGLTCYWQIRKDRNQCSFDEWVEMDLRYIRERGIGTDLKIIFKTFGAVLGMNGE